MLPATSMPDSSQSGKKPQKCTRTFWPLKVLKKHKFLHVVSKNHAPISTKNVRPKNTRKTCLRENLLFSEAKFSPANS